MEKHGQKCPAELHVEVWKLKEMLHEQDMYWLGGLARLVWLLQFAAAKALEGETKGVSPYFWLVGYDCFILIMVCLKAEGVWNFCETEFTVI